MLRYPCLVLDHDDTVVQSEATINYPFFCQILEQFRPGATITLSEYVQGCSDYGFVEMCRNRFQFTDEELEEEYRGWKEYIRHHIPAPYEGMRELLLAYRRAGGIICVVSMSSSENILRDYETHFGIVPDAVYGWDLAAEHRKPNPYAIYKIIEQFQFKKSDLLIVDDMKPAWEMATAADVDIAFAGWGRVDYPKITEEMTKLCDYAFSSTKDLADFLFL